MTCADPVSGSGPYDAAPPWLDMLALGRMQIWQLAADHWRDALAACEGDYRDEHAALERAEVESDRAYDMVQALLLLEPRCGLALGVRVSMAEQDWAAEHATVERLEAEFDLLRQQINREANRLQHACTYHDRDGAVGRLRALAGGER